MKNSVLFIEENEKIRESVARRLASAGINVITADCGIKAIELTAQQLPALIICEVMMKCMDGYAVFNALFKTLYKNKIPFIYVLGDAELQTAQVLSAENCHGDVFKGRDLLNCIKKYLPSLFDDVNSNISMSYIV